MLVKGGKSDMFGVSMFEILYRLLTSLSVESEYFLVGVSSYCQRLEGRGMKKTREKQEPTHDSGKKRTMRMMQRHKIEGAAFIF
jgi:hypothetical protein